MDDTTPTIYSNPDLLKQAEDLYFALAHNITNEGKTIIFHFIEKSKNYYYNSQNKEEWDRLLNNFQDVINDFENNFAANGEIKLMALQKNLEELEKKEI